MRQVIRMITRQNASEVLRQALRVVPLRKHVQEAERLVNVGQGLRLRQPIALEQRHIERQ